MGFIMKKSIRALLCLAVLFNIAVHAADCSKPETMFEMKECENDRFQKADKALNMAYKKLYGKLDDIGKLKLKKAQRAWITLRDLDANFFSDYARNGSLEGWVFIRVKATMTENRIKQLNDELEIR